MEAVKGAMEEAGLSLKEIAGTSMDTTSCTVVATDARAADQARRLGETGDPALEYNGYGAVLGSATLAGTYPDVRTAARNTVHVERQIEPDPERHEECQFYVDKYVETYPKMEDLMHETVRHVAG